MSEEFGEHEGLLDDDPALDFILYKEMEKEDQQSRGSGNGGCLSLLLFMAIPPAIAYMLIDIIA